MDTTPLTELEAVNIILINDGESPVSSLDEEGFSEAATAYNTLREISRTVQDSGWAFNTDYRRMLTPDSFSSEIILPLDTLWVRPTYTCAGRALVERNRKLYDLETHSYAFSTSIYVDLCQMLDFVELPSAARYYIALRAARTYQARSTGSAATNAFTAQDEKDAKAALKRADNRARPRGHFRSAENARQLTRRPF
jgi:hypothetical protein